MKNRLAITLALILCFASMTFAQTQRLSQSQGRSSTASLPVFSPPPGFETDVKPIPDDTQYFRDHIAEPLCTIFILIF